MHGNDRRNINSFCARFRYCPGLNLCSGSTNTPGKKLPDCKRQDVQFPIHRRSIEAQPFVSGIGNVDDLEIVEFLIKNISRTVRGATALPILA